MKDAIRLTNKTAVALRRGAQKARTAHYAAIAIMDIAAAVLSVYWGLKWLPAVPLTLALAALISAAVAMHGRRVYLQMIGQAICTEAAAREIRAGMSEQMRREQALSDLMSMKADVRRAQEKRAKPENRSVEKPEEKADEMPEPDADPFFEPAEEQEEEKICAKKAPHEKQSGEADRQESASVEHRRRRHKSLQLIRGEQAK